MQNKLQDGLRKDIISIKKSKNIYIFVDKTNNLYETENNSYNKLFTENISKTYWETNTNTKVWTSIYKEAKIITKEFVIVDRVDYLVITNAFIILKDHQ